MPPVPTLDPYRRWTFDDLHDLPEGVLREGYRYEVVDGAVVVTPSPSLRHQVLATRLCAQLVHAAPEPWTAVVAPPLPLGTDGRVPDLAVMRSDAVTRPGPYSLGPESFGLVVEVESPGSRKADRFTKPGEYAEAGIPLMWVVEQEPLRLRALVLDDGTFVQRALVEGRGPAPVPWGELVVDLDLASRL